MILNFSGSKKLPIPKSYLHFSIVRWSLTDEILEAFIRQYFQSQNYKEVVFSWQGGEPTLRGLDFFRCLY
jgi:sulfatase maturation enzyme AslB (radical SAM superfamily)